MLASLATLNKNFNSIFGFAGCNASQRLLKYLDGLPARNQMAIIDDDRGYRVDSRILVEAFAPTDLIRVFVTSKDFARAIAVQPDLFDHAQQDFVRAGAFAIREIGLEQGFLERPLQT